MVRPIYEISRARPARRGRWIPIGVGLALFWLIGLASGSLRGASRSVAATNYVFRPEVVTIAPGDTVSWTFAGEPHTVTSGTVTAGIPHPDGRFDSGIRLPGEAYVLGPAGAADPFARPGTYPYYCAVHAEQMTGTIIVQDGRTPQPTPGPTTARTSPPALSAPPEIPAPPSIAILTSPTPANPGLTRSSPQVDPTPPTGPSDGAATVSGPLIAGLVVLGALAVAIGLLARRARSGPRR